MKTCKTCKFHDKDFKNKEILKLDKYGICESHKIIGGEKLYSHENRHKIYDILMYEYDEGGYFVSGNDFGCVHHE